MKQINIYAAKTQLSQIIDRVSKGESFVIAKSGTPLAKLVPLGDDGPARIRFGLMKGRITIGPDFDAPLPDMILDAFEGEPSA